MGVRYRGCSITCGEKAAIRMIGSGERSGVIGDEAIHKLLCQGDLAHLQGQFV